MAIKWTAWAAVTASIILLLLALWITRLEADNELLRFEADSLNRERLALTLELEANRAALLSREAERERLANENAALVAAINEVYANDPAAKNWADALCPDGILCLLD